MPLCAVVIRHLPGSRPVTSLVIRRPAEVSLEKAEEFFQCAAQAHIKQVKQQLEEARSQEAAFYVDIVSSS